ncbi:hypothetical protein FB567DRAFT_593111 [Paraphoma chrysanthemicola]|uniref:SprT-like domain-containing protein n=1 Tax=Paraphoma chrysanthemicola TaxID=798071 RepID=A0A8K0R2D9_9PLEO|nr:hypothetical protein FB567DRAFT_593111 [Paraphoma chrysanthemicola]
MRILTGLRKCTTQPLRCPSEPYDLEAMIEAQSSNPSCTCDTCDPEAYVPGRHCNFPPHFRIKLQKDPVPNKLGSECYLVPKTFSNLDIKRAEPMHFARTCIEYFDRPEHQLNDTQLDALAQLRKWRTERLHIILSSQPATYLDRLISESEMRDLLGCINAIFFGHDYDMYIFRWIPTWSVPQSAHVRRSNSYSHRYIIEMLSNLPGPDPFQGRWMLEILGILLHEAVHVQLCAHACKTCKRSDENIRPGGHGRAWQLLAAAVERCFVKYLGLPVDLHRFGSLRVDWKKKSPSKLPSKHDMEEWKLDDALLMPFYADELLDAYFADGGEDMDIEKFAEGWWRVRPRLETVVRDGLEYYALKDARREKRASGDFICCDAGDGGEVGDAVDHAEDGRHEKKEDRSDEVGDQDEYMEDYRRWDELLIRKYRPCDEGEQESEYR